MQPTRLAVVLLCCVLLVGCASKPPQVTTAEASTPAQTPQSSPTMEATATEDASDDLFLEQRLRMVEQDIEQRGVSDQQVLEAMRSVPRHAFVPEKFLDQAYSDQPLPIGYGQTISQPYIVAWMTELLELEDGDKVLEIGTGSGYQAAVLAKLEGVQVYSIEIVPELAERAEATLSDLGYDQVHLYEGDGYYGVPEEAPFDAIIATAAPDHLPMPLVEQLSEDGRLVIPIGPVGGVQTLWKFVKEGGEIVSYNLGLVRFVPFTGEGAQHRGGFAPP